MRDAPSTAEGLDRFAADGLVAVRDTFVVGAIIPDYTGTHIVTVEGSIPRATHFSGHGTYEQTLASLGRLTTGVFVSPDFGMLPNKARIILYLAKAIPDGTPLRGNSLWQTLAGEVTAGLSNRQRIIAYGVNLLELTQAD